MKHTLFYLAALTLLPFMGTAQLKGLMKRVQTKVENKVAQRIEKRVDTGVENAMDEVEGKGQKKTADNPSNGKSEDSPKVNQGIKAYSKFDFVAGEQIIYSNDFGADKEGELPIGWNTNGNGVVAKFPSLKNTWVQFYQNSMYLTDNKDTLSENYTIEFDLLFRRENPKAAFPQIVFGILASGDLSTTDNSLLKDYTLNAAVELKIQPYDNNGSHMHLETFSDRKKYLNTDIKKTGHLQNYFNSPVHISMQVQKERLRIWMNEEKLYDLPKAIPAGTIMNQLFFEVKRYGGPNEEVGYAVSNIKIAKGLPDTRHKLMEEGKFSTTGIQFETNSAAIKAESTGVLKEVADLLKKFSDINILVVGHTDSEGSDAANLELSKKRAQAVKDFFNAEFGIDPARISTDGKGEKEAVADNSTREGKAQNRRVEFIKL